MRLSKLQKYVLTSFLLNKTSVKLKSDFYNFYSADFFKKHKKALMDSVHKSLDNLVAKDLLIAFGRKTAAKWFITKVKITPPGKKLAFEIIKNRQRKLPIK